MDRSARRRCAGALVFIAFVLFTGAGTTGAQDAGTGHGEHDHEEREHAENEHDEDGHAEHDIVALTAEQMAEFGIAVDSVGPATIEQFLDLPGEVVPNADRLAHIVPRFPGIVTEVRANIGDHVTKGEVLAIVESDQSLAPFEVRTLISGTVIGKHITLGEAVSRDRDAFVIADLSKVWVDVTVYQRDLGRVRVGQEAKVYLGHDVATGNARIRYVTPVLDEHTRTATARLVLENDDSRWRPGMFVTVRVLIEREEVPASVPRSALHTFEERKVVFVETLEGFRPRPVDVGREGVEHVEILSGLDVGDRYVREGGFTLKAELGKGDFGHGHAH